MKRSVWMTAFTFLAVTAWVLFRGPGMDSQPDPSVAQAAAAPSAPRAVVAPGRVEPVSEEVAIGTELDGKLATVSVEEGETVRRGQVIASLVNGDFVARVRLAESAVHERKAELERLRNGNRTEERRESDAFVTEARAVLEQARAERDRRKYLLDRGAISRTEFETADREFNVARRASKPPASGPPSSTPPAAKRISAAPKPKSRAPRPASPKPRRSSPKPPSSAPSTAWSSANTSAPAKACRRR